MQVKTRQNQRLKNKWTHNNTEASLETSGTSQSEDSEDRGMVKKTKKKGKLTERLISQGLLTPQMIEELKREIENRET